MAPSQLAIVGAGPRGVGVLERLSANAPELLGPAGLVVHLIDPFPPGAGRIWRYEQSPLLRMNSMTEDVGGAVAVAVGAGGARVADPPRRAQ